jgi:hypothetical protein
MTRLKIAGASLNEPSRSTGEQMISTEIRIRKTDQEFFKRHPEAQQYVRFAVPGEELGPFVEVTLLGRGVRARRTAKLTREDVITLFPPADWRCEEGKWRALLDRRIFAEFAPAGDDRYTITVIVIDGKKSRSSAPIDFVCPSLAKAKAGAAMIGRCVGLIHLIPDPTTKEQRVNAYKRMMSEIEEALSTDECPSSANVVNLADFKGGDQ